MGLLNIFGAGEKQLLAEGIRASGRVTATYECWFIKVNTKPVRMNGMDGAMFPHIITFRYVADGVEYQGRRWLNWNERCPQVGGSVTVCYDEKNPRKYAVIF